MEELFFPEVRSYREDRDDEGDFADSVFFRQH